MFWAFIIIGNFCSLQLNNPFLPIMYHPPVIKDLPNNYDKVKLAADRTSPITFSLAEISKQMVTVRVNAQPEKKWLLAA